MKPVLKIGCILFLLCAVTASRAAFAQKESGQDEPGRKEQGQKEQVGEKDSHQYAPLRQVEVEIRDFTFPGMGEGNINLREAARGKKLVLAHYFASWCHNSNFDVETLTELYDKYRDQGFLVIGVCEYSSRNELREFLKKHKPTYPICIETDGKRKERTSTTHYTYRSKIGDERLWGTPLNILITEDAIQNEGDVFATRVRIATGEVVKSEIEEIIRHRLQLN